MKYFSTTLARLIAILPMIVLCSPSKTTGTAPEEPETYDVFLLIGQSNMAGRGTMTEEDKTIFDKNVYVLNSFGVPEPARNPLNMYSTIRKDISMQGINPGYSFSKKIAGETGRKVLLVVNARGDTGINEWAEGTEYYSQAVERITQAARFGTVKAVLWHQGEKNRTNPAGYLEKLNAMVECLRRDTGIQDLPFIAGEIAQWVSNADAFNAEIQKIPDVIPNSGYVSSEGCSMLKDSSDPHFSREGQLLLGERYADKVLEMCYGK